MKRTMFHPKGPTLWELTQQALSSTTKGYDLLAEKFEYTPFRTPDVLLEPLAEAVSREPVMTALDACCGNGALARAIRPHVYQKIVGIDVSEGMLEDARRRIDESEGQCEVAFVNQDVLTMDYDNAFDVIVTSGAFGHILPPDQDNFAQRIWNALAPGGRFIFLTGKKPPKSDPAYWMARGFNAVMHVRNAVLKPPFIMFYLTFTVDRACDVLWRHGFEIQVESPFAEGTQSEFQNARLVIAQKPFT